MNDFKGLYNIRDFKEADTNFVLSTFMRGLYYGDSWFSLIPKNIFMINYKKVAENFIKNNKYVIKIACLKEDPDVVLGYSILSDNYSTINWVFVKSAWRNKGIGTSLLPLYPATVTHLSKTGVSLLKKYKNVVFNPFAL